MKHFLAVIVAVGVASIAPAAEVKFNTIGDAACEQFKSSEICITVTLEGPIAPGDAARFEAEVKRMNAVTLERLKSPSRVGLVLLNSPGGDVREAMRIGRTIRAGVMATQVPFDAQCHSSCVIALLGGVVRLQLGDIGIHSFYSKAFLGTEEFSIASDRYNDLSAEVERYLKDLRIPLSLVDEMRKVPHNQIRVLEFEERERLGITGVDPVFLQTRRARAKVK